MSGVRHLVQTREVFAAWVAEFGPDAVLHPANRLTACGRHSGSLSITEYEDRVTCKTCIKAMRTS